jgi:multiple antibiotic resistance protein
MPDLTFFLYAFTSIFVIVNPVSGVMAFISLTSNMSVSDKRHIAGRSILIACVMAIVFSFTGDLILRFFNITADSLRVAGGVLLFLVAMDMLYGRLSRERLTAEEIRDASERENISVFPLAMPMLTGPGAITTIIVLIQRTEPLEKIAVIAAILTTFILSYIIFRYSEYLNRVFGVTGMLVMTRIMGLFLGAIAVDFIATGIWNIYLSHVSP